MVSHFSEIETINGHEFDSMQDVTCGCWGLCHCGAIQCRLCGYLFSYGTYPTEWPCPGAALPPDSAAAL